MAEINKRQYKDLDKRIRKLTDWVTEQKESFSDRNLVNNFSFMISVMENYQKAMDGSKKHITQMQEGLAENYQVVDEFLEKFDQKENWESFLTEKREEAQRKLEEDNDPNFRIKQELAEAEANVDEEVEDEGTKE